MLDLVGSTYVSGLSTSIYDLLRFHLFLSKTLADTNCSRPKKIIIHVWGPPVFQFVQTLTVRTFFIDPNCLLIPDYQNFISCFVVDICTISAKAHSCFLVDIDLVSKICRISLGDSSSFPVPVFPKLTNFSQNPER